MPKAKRLPVSEVKRDLPTDPDALLTKTEAAQVLGVTDRWMKRAVERRRFPITHVGRLVRIRLSDLHAYIEQQRAEAR